MTYYIFMNTLPLLLFSFLPCLGAGLQARDTALAARPAPEFSTAGFYNVPDSPRTAHNFNLGWKFSKGNPAGAEKPDFDDLGWTTVNVPHGLELVPEESSGCANYQGPAWYRKQFTAPREMKGKRAVLYFESIMGKSRVYLNGKLVRENAGGYLPVIVDITDELQYGKPNTVAVFADNTDDGSYPPGKPQKQLDFSYFGGIYRDVYLIETSPIYITDANQMDEVAGGGVFFRTNKLTKGAAEVGTKIQIANDTAKPRNLTIHARLTPRGEEGGASAGFVAHLSVGANATATLDKVWMVKQPRLWSPDAPNLYDLQVTVKDAQDNVLDTYKTRVGIRTFRMNEKEGLVLNEKPFDDKLIGGNRHQDFAYLGNAVPNIGQWRDAKKMRDAGMRVVRSAHYPMDPAFMDAADELGLFVIVCTPGWQYWNKTPEFEQKVYSNIKNMVRRDRNHPSVWAWEPILNETYYPDTFAAGAYETTHKEYPYPGCYAACDAPMAGAAQYDMVYAHPKTGENGGTPDKYIPGKAYFTREFGDNVDNWSAHNSPSRTHRKWGELPMLTQAVHYTAPAYPYTCWETLYKTPKSHLGGALWHPFDHQRGYHPDPFYGGIMDAFRQPKTSFYAFQSQRPRVEGSSVASGPMVYIAHEMTPFSPQDVTVFTNCDEVRLTAFKQAPVTQKARKDGEKRPGSTVVFEKAFDFMKLKGLDRSGRRGQCELVAEGLIDGKVVATHRVAPAARPEKITLTLDNEGAPLQANGTDFAVVVAQVTDGQGNVKRLNNEVIQFEVKGEAEIIGDAGIGANPRPVEWGTAPVLIRTTSKAGPVKISAKVRNEGSQKPASGVLEFSTVPSAEPFIIGSASQKAPVKASASSANAGSQEVGELKRRLELAEKELNLYKNKEVEKQQSATEHLK